MEASKGPQKAVRVSRSRLRVLESENLASKKLRGDRLSSLPESVLQHILSFLPIEHAVKTSVLSNAWRYLWTGVHTLAFTNYGRFSHLNRFADSVDETLAHHCSPKVQKLLIESLFRIDLKSRADSWLRFAVDRQVEELNLVLRAEDPEDCYVLPCFLYNHSTLTKLSSHGCVLEPSGGVHLPSLKVLSLEYYRSENDALATILSGCPSLERLKLDNWEDFPIKCRSRSLKEFTLQYFTFNFRVCLVEVWAPNLRSLTVLEEWYRIEYKLIDASSLVELRLESGVFFRIQEPDVDRFLIIKMMHLLQQLDKLEKLTLAVWKPPKDVTERGSRSKLLDERKAFWRSQCTAFSCLHQTLKSVEIINFEPQKVGWEFIDSLVEFLLNNALLLEKIVICTRNDCKKAWKSKNLLGAAKYISGYKRASPTVEVLVEGYVV